MTAATIASFRKFNSLALALSYADRLDRLHVVFMGDDNRFWIVPMRNKQSMLNAGYEIAK